MKIVTDSAADLVAQEIEDLDIIAAPLHIQFPDGEINSDRITPDEFYTRLKKMEPQIPSTSQPSAGVFEHIYRSLANNQEEILSIHISSGLSGTIESARLGARQVPEADVTVFDSMTLSGGQRFAVLAAAQGAKAGMSKQVILERLEKIRAATEVAFTLETLNYLARGGRIGRVQALAGTLLKIKPVIYVDKTDGKYNSAGKGRTLSRSMELIVEHHIQAFGAGQPVWVTVLHGQFLERAEELSRLISERMYVVKMEVLRISPVLGVHTGPCVVGAAAIPIELMEGLE